MRLAAKLMFVFLTAVMLMTTVASYFSVRRAFDRFEKQQREMASQTARQIDESLLEAWQSGGTESLTETVEQLRAPYVRTRIRWVWFERGVPVDNRPELPPQHWSRFATGEILSITSQDAAGQRKLHTYYPFEVEKGRRGGLEFTESLEELDDETQQTIRTALVSIGGMALLAVGMVYLAGVRWVAQPLDRLIDKTRRAGEGDFSGPLEVAGSDELSQLGQSLNQMCAQLAEQQQRIEAETARRLTTLEQLRHADRLKTVGRLAAGVAHEMGTPLNVVSGRAELIESGKLSEDDIRVSASAIRKEADRIAGIIRQLLDFARQRSPLRSKVDIGEIVTSICNLLKPLAHKASVDIEFEPPESPIALLVDRGQIQQVLTNIVVNAIQSMPDGGQVDLTVVRETRQPPDSPDAAAIAIAAVRICDQGGGISETDQGQIFEPFFTTKDIGEGTGLGLSIAYGIMQEHGGWIEVESQLGQGSCFTVCIPDNVNNDIKSHTR